MHELRVPAARGMPAYVELSVAAEGIFTNHNQATPLPEDGGDLERFLATYGASLLCYGYPYLQYADGSIRPLFLMRAKIDDGVLYPDPDGHVKMNCSLLRDQGMEPSLMQVLAHKWPIPPSRPQKNCRPSPTTRIWTRGGSSHQSWVRVRVPGQSIGQRLPYRRRQFW